MRYLCTDCAFTNASRDLEIQHQKVSNFDDKATGPTMRAMQNAGLIIQASPMSIMAGIKNIAKTVVCACLSAQIWCWGA